MIPLADKSVNCCVTSPPYWGLRDYGTAKWDGGSPDCDHFRLAGGTKAQHLGKSSTAMAANVERSSVAFKEECGKCGAIRIDKQLGLERTPEEYIAAMLEVFREVKRVLRDDGTLWLNMGDSYAGSWGNYHPNSPPGKHGQRLKETERWNRPGYSSQEFLPPTANIVRGKRIERGGGRWGGGSNPASGDLKPKDLVGIPWMLAFALRADGWYLRSDIIWAKPNSMPESVTDRPTKAHEYIFLFSKSQTYYYDAEAIKEEATGELPWGGRPDGKIADERAQGNHGNGSIHKAMSREEKMKWYGGTRNKRSVWTVTTNPFPEAHFATFPEELIKPCILAGCPVGGTVLDPFAGSGTTLLVARNLQCKGIGLELNPAYIEIAKRRLAQNVMDFTEQRPAAPLSRETPE